jgi:hypothetical protein
VVTQLIVVISYGLEEINGESVGFWRVHNSHGVRWGNNGYDHISMNIMTPDGKPLVNGRITPMDFIRWSHLGVDDKKRRKNFDQTSDRNKVQ